MKDEIVKASADGVISIATGLGVLSSGLMFLNKYAGALTFLLSLVFGVYGIILHRNNNKKLNLADENKRAQELLRSDLDAHTERTEKQFAQTNLRLDQILSKLDKG